MKTQIIRYLVPTVAACLVAAAVSRSAERTEPKLAHMVFFALKDHSKASRERFIASCEKYLSNHPGTVYFSVGTLAEDVKEPVSVLDFDVALHLVLENKEAKERYLTSERHKSFVEENKPFFGQVRVFDSYLAAGK